jgi:hypothetical protein
MVSAQVGICGPPGAERGDPVQDRHALSHERSADHGSKQPAAGKADQRRPAPENTCSKYQLDFLQFRDPPPDTFGDRALLAHVIIIHNNHADARCRDPVVATAHHHVHHRETVILNANDLCSDRDGIAIRKGKFVFTTGRAEDRSDAGIVFQFVQSEHFRLQDAGAFEIPEVNGIINVLK